MASEMDDSAGDLDEERKQIMKLQSEMARKKEQILRLQSKKDALSEEYQNRSNDLRDLKNQIKAEELKMGEKRSMATTDDKEEEAVADFIKTDVTKLLKERIPLMAELEEDEDEDEAPQVEKKEQQEEPYNKNTHNSVLVLYHVWSAQSTENRDTEFYVTYRIDRNTTIEGLHGDACKYWGCSTQEYCLCRGSTYSLLQDKPPDSKVQDHDILPPNEMAMLHLVKRQDWSSWMQMMKEEDKKKKVEKPGEQTTSAPSADQVNKTTAKAATDASARAEPWLNSFKEWPGLHHLLTTRQVKMKGNRVGVTCRDIFITIITLTFLLTAGFLRTSVEDYSIYETVHRTTVQGIEGETSSTVATNMLQVNRYDQIWDWLGGTFHYQAFNSSSTLRRFYEPVGGLRIRQQKVKVRVECRRPELEASLGTNPVCLHTTVDDSTLETGRLIINATLFALIAQGGRARDFENIAVYRAPPDWDLPLEGIVSNSYHGGGYEIIYASSPTNETDEDDVVGQLLEDLNFIRNDWISLRTRLITVEMVFANYHRGSFVNAAYMFELTASGAVHPSTIIRPFRTTSVSKAHEVAGVLEVIAYLIQLIWIIGPRARFEIMKKTLSKRPGYMYLLSFGGVLDMQAVALPIVILVMQGFNDMPKPSELASDRFFSYNRNAYYHKELIFARAIFFFLIMMRLSTFAKLFPQVSQFSKVMGRSIYLYFWYMFIVLPLLAGIVFLGSSIYAGQLLGWSSWWEALVTTLLLVRMDVDVIEMERSVPQITVVFVTYFVFFMTVFFLFGFMAIGAHAYFEVKLIEAPSEKSRWDMDQWLDWLLWGRLYKLITKKDPGSSLREVQDKEEDEGDSGSDSDEDDAGAAAKDK